LFVAAGIAVSLLFGLIEKLIPEADTPTFGLSVAGAALGLVVGVLVAFALVWIYTFVRDIQPAADNSLAADKQNSRIEKLSNRIASKAVSGAMSLISARPEVAGLSTALVVSPGKIAGQAQRLAKSDDLKALFGDPKNQAVLNKGDTEALQKLPAFQQLASNPDMLALASTAGMLSDTDNEFETMEAILASRITDIWGRMQRVKNNDRVQEILNDPEFQQKIQSSNPLDLVTNVRLLELADIIFEDAATTNNTPTGDGLSETAKEKPKVFSWTDDNGRIHYSDVEPES
jgi:hypothetical protein